MAAAKRQKRPQAPKNPSARVEPAAPVSKTPVAAQRWQPFVAPLLVLGTIGVAVTLVYGPGVRAAFVHDDGASIQTNYSIVRLWPLFGSPGPLNPNKDLPTSGRPLVNLTFALNYHFGQFNPVGYHVFNYAVHVLNATLLWAIVRRVLRLDYFNAEFDRQADWLAFAIALVWALHPLQTQSVEYITQRSELMLSLCYLGTMYASLRYLTTTMSRQRSLWLIVTTLSCVAGMACKEVMATAPLMVALLDCTLIAGSWRRAIQHNWPLYVALSASWLLLLALNIGGPRAASAGFQDELPAHVWWLTQCKVLWIYVKLAFWPSPLLMHYELPRLETFGAAWRWVLPVAAVMVTTLVLLCRKRATGFLGAWFFLILAPTLVVPIVTEVAAERRMYLPLAAIVTFVTIGAFTLAERIARRVDRTLPADARVRRAATIIVAAAAVLAAICGVASARRVKVYLDAIALWQGTLDAQPDNIAALSSLAELLQRQGRGAEGMELMQKALALEPNSYLTQTLAGSMLLSRGQHAEAIEHFRKAVELNPNSNSAKNNLAFALHVAGQTQQAIEVYNAVLDLDPNYVEAHFNLATALANQGKFDDAFTHYAAAVRLHPDMAGAHRGMGIILLNSKQLPEAIEHLAIAAKLEPAVDTYVRLAIAQANSKQVDQALKSIDLAIDLARASRDWKLVDQLQARRANLQTLQPGVKTPLTNPR